MHSYAYRHRKGVLPLSWDDIARLSAQLVERLYAEEIEAIVGIARAGLFPATSVACELRKELFPARLTRRKDDLVVHPRPVWKTPISQEVAGKTIAIVDEIADSGETLALAKLAAEGIGARRVLTACLVSHTWADPAPDLSILATDELVIFPWDRRVFINGRWQPHPELVAALAAQGIPPDPFLRD